MSILLALVLGLAFLGTNFGLAGAQDGAVDPEGTGDPRNSEVNVRRRANLTPAEQLTEARDLQGRSDQSSRRATIMLDEARQDRDIIRVTCLNDKLTQINANGHTMDVRVDNLVAAVESQDTDRGDHEFTVIVVLDQKIAILNREAVRCIGEEIFETGATSVTTEIDEGSPIEDPSVIPEPPPSSPVPFVPPPASGTL